MADPDTQPTVNDLIGQLETATAGGLTLDRAIGDTYGIDATNFTTSFEQAYGLLPISVTNFNLFSFGVRDGAIGDGWWGCRVHDQAQLIGAERAQRLTKRLKLPLRLGGEPQVFLERAIAQQYCEFSTTHTATAVLAICTVALKVRIGRTTDDDLWPEPRIVQHDRT